MADPDPDLPEWNIFTLGHMLGFIGYLVQCAKVTLIYCVQFLTLQHPASRRL